MSGVNINISLSGLPHFEPHQDKIHQGPVVNQQQNAQIVNSETLQRISRPVEAEHPEGKIIDTGKSTEQIKDKKKKKSKKDSKKSLKNPCKRDDGYFVDIQA